MCYYLSHFKRLIKLLFESNKNKRLDMALTANIGNFFHDVREATGKAVGALPEECSRISLIGNGIVIVLDTSCRKATAHYPKTVLVALIVSSVAAVLLLPFSLSLFVLGANSFFLYNHGRRLFGVIQIYNMLHISEWTAAPEAKHLVGR
jgi:hypothetical protein